MISKKQNGLGDASTSSQALTPELSSKEANQILTVCYDILPPGLMLGVANG
jgi:hypothetical protein